LDPPPVVPILAQGPLVRLTGDTQHALNDVAVIAAYRRCSTDDEHQPFSITAQETALGSSAKSQLD
jgi:hypothetical protein